MYLVEVAPRAQKFLDSLDMHLRGRIEERLRKLSDNPIPSDTKFICRENGEKIFRYRIGDYRALYKVKDQLKIVLVVKIDKRPRVYDNR